MRYNNSKQKKKDNKMLNKLKDNLAGVAALLGVIAAIGGGFVKYGELTTKINQLEASQGVDLTPVNESIANLKELTQNTISATEQKIGIVTESTDEKVDELKVVIKNVGAGVKSNEDTINKVDTKAEVNSKEIELLKLQIKELQLKAKNPLSN